MGRAARLALLVVLPCLGPACGGSGPATHAMEAVPVLTADPPSLAFTATETAGDPTPRRIVVRNTGRGEIAWAATESCPWITLTTPTGGDGDAFDVHVNASTLSAGHHADGITLTDEAASNSPVRVPVTLDVAAVPPAPPCGCGALPAPTGETVRVTTLAELVQAVGRANTGTGPGTILIEDGTYTLSEMLHVTADDVTIRGASGDRDAVILRGDGMSGTVSHVFLVAGRRFTVADVTVGWVYYHAIQIQGEQDADDARVHNLRIVDTGEQMLKVSYAAGSPVSGDRGVVECCLFEYTAGIGPQYYIGGVDCHQGADWIVRHNTFHGIRSPEAPLAEHAIHFWSDASGTLVEGNVIVDCDRGIGFGLGDRGHRGGVIRNNMVYTTRDVGIGLENASDVTVLHNTVYANGYGNAIEYRFDATSATIVGNLTYGSIALRNGASGSLSDNYEMTATDDFLVDPPSGDLHLTSADPAVVDQATPRADLTQDIDCDARPSASPPDIGADEWTGS